MPVTLMLLATLGGCGDSTRPSPRPAGPAVTTAPTASAPASTVQTWTEVRTLPTYPVGPASDFPEFVRASGLFQPVRGLYPYTLQRDLSFDKGEQKYEVYVLQNEYLRLEVIPSLGGRLFAMYDRITGQDILYRQPSIKPALVGLRGAWISGGIEWNFPRGHSVTTHDTVSCQFRQNADGSASILIGDTERCFHMSWTVELRLAPGQAKMQTNIICRNITPVAHEGYWWSNACFPANDQLQLIYPFNKVTGHDAGGADDWPVRNGKDMSWYKAWPESVSVFRAAGEEDFIAAYDHGRDLGLAQFADRHVMPGRKWFTWGTSQQGKQWAKTLSDDGRPYVEIQSGCPLTQSDQFKLQPQEEKQFIECWMPVTRIGPPARLNAEAVVRLTVDKDTATVGVLPTSKLDNARVELSAGGKVLKTWQQSLSPKDVLKDTCPLDGAKPDDLWLRVYDAAGREVIAHRYGHYAAGESLLDPNPRPSFGPGPRPTSQPTLRPQSDGERLDSAVAQLAQGLYEPALKTLQSLAADGGKGVDAAALAYYLGLANAGMGQAEEAMKQWDSIQTSGEFQDAAAIEIAKVLLRQKQWAQASARLFCQAGGRQCNVQAAAYTAFALRQMNKPAEAKKYALKALQRDGLSLLAQIESALLDGGDLTKCSALRDEERRIEAATAYMAIGDYATAKKLLTPPTGAKASVTAQYLLAQVEELSGNKSEAVRLRGLASKTSDRGAMPSRLEELAALEAAVKADDKDANAHYLAGLALYGLGRKADGIAQWRRSAELNYPDAVLYRCLADTIRDQNLPDATKYLQQAIAAAPDAAEVYADLDYAYLLQGESAKRIEILQQGLKRMPDKDDLAHRLGVAYFDAGRYDDAVKCYQSHRFHVAEGQTDLHDNYSIALVARAVMQLKDGKAKEALADLDAALEYPENLGIGKPDRGGNSCTVQFWRSVALGQLSQADEAKKALKDAASAPGLRLGRRMGFWRPDSAVQAVHAIIALRQLGQKQEADDLAGQISEVARRAEEFDQTNGKPYAALLDALLTVAAGDSTKAAKQLDQVQATPSRSAGFARLGKTWAELLVKQDH